MESLVGHILTQYLGDYFVNFSSEKFHMSLLSGIISVNDLVFDTSINDRLSFPFKLKYGQLGNLEIKLQSYTNISKGMSCKVKDVFLCFEMLEMENWKKETVISKDQELKKFTLEGFEKSLEIQHGELEKTKEEVSSETLQAILANLKIEVENIYIRLEDEQLKFSMGYLLPKIDVVSTDKNFVEVIEHITDLSVLFKKLKVDDVSAFINTDSNFQPLHVLLGLREHLRVYMKNLDEHRVKILSAAVKKLIENTFEDSKRRLQDKSYKSSHRIQSTGRQNSQSYSNDYIFMENPVTIECNLKYVQDVFKANREAQENLNKPFNEPTFELSLTLGGEKIVNKNKIQEGLDAEKAIKQVISEEQLYVTLHIATFLSAYENFSQGVLQNQLKMQNSGSVSLYSKINVYKKQYIELLEYQHDRTHDRDFKQQLDLRLEQLAKIDKNLSTEVIMKVRYYIASYFYGKRKIEAQFEKENAELLRPMSSGFGLNMFGGRSRAVSEEPGGRPSKNNQTLGQLQANLQNNKRSTLKRLDKESLGKLEKYGRGELDEDDDDAKIANLTQASQHTSLGNDDIAEEKAFSGEMNWFRMRCELPKLQIEVHPKADIEDSQSNVIEMIKSTSEKHKFQQHHYADRVKLGTISIEGLRIEVETKASSEQSLFKVNMDSLWIHDPNVQQEIELLNKGANFEDMLEKPTEYVIKTIPQEEKQNHARQEARQNTERMTTLMDNAERSSGDKQKEGKLFSLQIETVKMEDYKKERNAQKRENQHIRTIPEQETNHEDDLKLTTDFVDSDSEDKGQSNSDSEDNGLIKDFVDADEENKSAKSGGLSARSNNARAKVQEYHTNVVFNINGQIIVYSNFFFIKKVLQLVTGIATDMEQKRTMLTANINDPEVLENIIHGFEFLKEIKEAAYKRMEELRQEQLRRQTNMAEEERLKQGADDEEIISPTDISLFINRPKIIFDEYLLGQSVIDDKMPAIFMLNMGSWVFNTAVYKKNIEKHTSFCHRYGMAETGEVKWSKDQWSQCGTYESIDLRFLQLSLRYSPYSSNALLENIQRKNVVVFEKLDLGVQIMTLLKQQGQDLIPDYLINVLLNKLELKFDRSIFCQILKIQAFFNHGTWLEDMKLMSEALARSQDFSAAKTRQKRLTSAQKSKTKNNYTSNSTIFQEGEGPLPGHKSQIQTSAQPNRGLRFLNASEADSDETIETKKAQDDIAGTGSRIKLIFNELALVVQTVTWHPKEPIKKNDLDAKKSPSGSLLGSVFSDLSKNIGTSFNKQAKLRKSYDIKQDFEVRVNSLKIALNFPEIQKDSKTWIMDCLVFLQEVNVSDLAHPNWQQKNLLIYKSNMAAEDLNFQNKPNDQARKSVLITGKKQSSLANNLLQGLEQDNRARAVSQTASPKKKSKNIVFHERSASQDKKKPDEVVVKKDMKAFFLQFDVFLAFREFLHNKNQFGIRFNSETQVKEVVAEDPNGLEREESTTTSNKVINVGEIEVVAIFDLVQRLLQWNWNLLYDLTNMDIEYHDHIKFQAECMRKKQKSKFGKFKQNQLQNQGGALMEVVSDFTTTVDQAKSGNKKDVSPLEDLKHSQSLKHQEGAGNDKRKMTLTDIHQVMEIKKLLQKDSSVDNSSSLMSDSRNMLVSDIFKVVLELWNDETKLIIPSMKITVPSNLTTKNDNMDEDESSLHIEAGMDIVMKYAMTTKTKYDIQNALYPINIDHEVQDSDYEQKVNLQKLRLFMTGSHIQEQDGTGDSMSNFTSNKSQRTKTKKMLSRQSKTNRTARQQALHSGMNIKAEKNLLDEVSFEFLMIWKTLENSAITDQLLTMRVQEEDGQKVPSSSHLLAALNDSSMLNTSKDSTAQATKKVQHEYKQLGLSIMRTTFHDKLKLSIRMKELRAFQNLLQLILSSNNQILALDSQPLDQFKIAQERMKGQRDHRVKSAQNEQRAKDKKTNHLSITTEPHQSQVSVKGEQGFLPNIRNVLGSPESCMSIKSEGNLQEMPSSIVKTMGNQQNSTVRVNDNNRATLMNFNADRDQNSGNVSEVSESIHDIFNLTEEKDEGLCAQESDGHDNGQANRLKEQTINQIVELHVRKHDAGSQVVRQESSVKDMNRTLIWGVMDIFFNDGLQVGIDDEFTSDYDEYVIGLVAKDFSMKSSYLWADLINQFRTSQHFERDQEVMLKQLLKWWKPDGIEPYPLMSHMVAYDQGINMDFEVIYFNKSTFCLEPLIEPYKMKFSVMQEMPLSQVETCILSDVMMNINLTYGCIVSIQDTLQLIRKEELDMTEFLNARQQIAAEMDKPFQSLLSRRSRTKTRILDDVSELSGESASRIEEQKGMLGKLKPAAKKSFIQFENMPSAGSKQQPEQVAAELTDEMKIFLKKLDLVNSSGKRFEVWLTNEQVYLTGKKDNDFNQSFYIDLTPNKAVRFTEDKDYANKLMKLFESYKTPDEIRKAQIYMHIRAEGANGDIEDFRRIWNLPVYQTGLQSLKLKRDQSGVESQYFLLHTTHTLAETQIVFESIAIVYNRLSFPVHLNAFMPGKKKGTYEAGANGKLTRGQIYIDTDQVGIIPISWFEQGYEVRVSHQDANTSEIESVHQNVVLSNIKKILNPQITEPYEQLGQQIKLKKYWVAFEVALLQTRSRDYGQFVMALNYVCKFNNLMMTPIKIVPHVISKFEAKDKHGDDEKNSESFESDVFSGESEGGKDDEQLTLHSDSRQSFPRLNLEKAGEEESSFTLNLQLGPGLDYAAEVNYAQLQKMNQNKTIGFQNGLILNLHRKTVTSSKANINLSASKIDKTLDLEVISVVLEKVPRTGTLKNCAYDTFTLRNKLFFHQASYYIEVYAPLMAVNLTKNVLNIFDTPKKGLSKTSVELPPERSTYINLHKDIKAKLFMASEGFEVSKAFSFQEVGMQNIISMQQKLEPSQKKEKQVRDSRKKIELATMIQSAQAPYEKTKILRIVQRTVLINQLRNTIICKEPYRSANETVLGPGDSIDYDFLADNINNQLHVKLEKSMHSSNSQKEESKNGIKDHKLARDDHDQHTISLNQPINSQMFATQHERHDWSYVFKAESIDDFQITLCQQGKGSDKSWASQGKEMFVRVSIRQDQIDEGKLIVVFQHPLEPEFFCINYTPYELKVKQKEQSSEYKNDSYMLKAASQATGSSGLPIVLNPALPKSADELKISMHQKGKNFNVKIGKNEVTKMQFEGQVTIQAQTRKSGSCWLIEFHEGDTLLSGSATCDEDQETWFERVFRQAVGIKAKDEKEAEKFGLKKFSIAKSLMIVKLAGLGISMVDYNPRELCYFSLEGIVFLQEHNVYNEDRRQKTFKKMEVSIRNLQLDDCISAGVPIVFGPKKPFRNIERVFKKSQNISCDPIEQHYLRAWLCTSEESDGTINTKTIEDIQVEMIETELNIQVKFLGQVQDLLGQLSKLSTQFGVIGSSTISVNMSIVNQLLMWQDPGITFKQENLIFSVYEQLRAKLDKDSDRPVDTRMSQVSTQVKNGLFPRPEDICKQLDPNKKEHLPGSGSLAGAENQDADHTDSVMNLNKVFIENMVIKKIVINANVRLRGVERILKKRGPLGLLINIGSNFGDISGAEIMFSELEFAGLNETSETISLLLTQHYRSEALTQWFQIATQQDILGNPGSFIKNLAKAGGEAKSAPFDAFLTSDPKKKGVKGCYGGIQGLVSNTTLAVSTSYSGISGSLYLGLRNLSNARLGHADLDRPLSIGGAVQKGGKGFALELWYGISGVYTVPRKRIRMQGVGGKQITKGVAQGLFQLVTSPINAVLRGTYNMSTGVKNKLHGSKMQPQRFRHPRYIDSDMKMQPYESEFSHAATAIRECKNGKHANEVIRFALDLSCIINQRFIQQVVLITNQSILLIKDQKNLAKSIPLRKIRGTMVYYYNHKSDARSTVNMELDDGSVVKLETKQPQQNTIFVRELRRQLEQLERLDRQNQDDMTFKDRLQDKQVGYVRSGDHICDDHEDCLADLNRQDIHNIYDTFSFEANDDDEFLTDDEAH